MSPERSLEATIPGDPGSGEGGRKRGSGCMPTGGAWLGGGARIYRSREPSRGVSDDPILILRIAIAAFYAVWAAPPTVQGHPVDSPPKLAGILVTRASFETSTTGC